MLVSISISSAENTYVFSRYSELKGGALLHPQSLAVQPDGKILVGDYFGYLDWQNNPDFTFLTRWNANGTLDQSFNAKVEGAVFAIVVQENGKIIIGGNFDEVNGERRFYLTRLNGDGSLDNSWNTNTDFRVYEIKEHLNDGFVLIGGFQTVGGNSIGETRVDRNRVAKIDVNGNIDLDFDPNANGEVSSMAVQTNGKIFVSGRFSSISGEPRDKLARLNSDGTLDRQFQFEGNFNSYYALDVDLNEKVIIGAATTDEKFNRVTTLLKLNIDGSIEDTLAIVQGEVYRLLLLGDQSLLVGGKFEMIGDTQVRNLARLTNSGEVDDKLNFTRVEDVYAVDVKSRDRIFVGDRGRIMKLEEKSLVDDNFCIPIKGHSNRVVVICL